MLTTFNNGVYTACEPCEEKPDKAPIWRIKAQKIIWNGKAKTVRFEHSRFEFFGMPIAYFPAFEIADPTVKRKTGFLIPGITYKSDLGVGVIVPYYFALSPTYDLTLTGTLLHQAGLPRRGRVAAALQQRRVQPQDRRHQPAGSRGVRRRHASIRARPATRTSSAAWSAPRASSTINPRWAFGWDVLVQTDKNFSRHLRHRRLSASYVHRSEVYLTGLDDRNYFDLRAMHFEVQEDMLDDEPRVARNDKQPWVLPTLRLFLHAGRAGVRRRAELRRQRARSIATLDDARSTAVPSRAELRARHRRHQRPPDRRGGMEDARSSPMAAW